MSDRDLHRGQTVAGPSQGKVAALAAWVLFILSIPSANVLVLVGLVVSYVARGSSSGVARQHIEAQIRLFWSVFWWTIVAWIGMAISGLAVVVGEFGPVRVGEQVGVEVAGEVGAQPRRVCHDLVASAVYVRPHELASIGLTEEAAAAQGPIEVYEALFRPMRSLFAGSDLRAMMKLVVDDVTRRVLGCHIFAPEAGEMIQLAAVAIGMGATKEQFDAAIAVHPTLAEELVTMRMPVRRAGGAAV